MSTIIITGNPVDGFKHYGPLPDEIDLDDPSLDNIRDGNDWWMAQLDPVEGTETAAYEQIGRIIVKAYRSHPEHWHNVLPIVVLDDIKQAIRLEENT